MNKHNKLVESLEARLKNIGYKSVHKFSTYWAGEVDLFCIKKENVLVFEVKTNNTIKGRKKAHEQLSRASKLFFDRTHRVFKFYAYWDKTSGDAYKIEWYRR